MPALVLRRARVARKPRLEPQPPYRGNSMIYLSQMLGEPVVDANGEKIGSISDLAIQTGEVFPRITSLAFLGPGKRPS